MVESGNIVNIRFVQSVGPTLSGKIRLMEPTDIVINQLHDIYISDSRLNMILKLSSGLDVISYEGGIGETLGDFNRPTGIACDAALNLYVADRGNRRIQVLDRNLHPASAITEYFASDGSTREFRVPEDVAIDFEGNVWVADDDRVLKLNPFYELELELSYSSPAGLSIGKAASIATTGTGIIAIGDSGNKKVFVVSTYGNSISEFNTGPITSIAWEGGDIIWVCSRLNRKITAFDIYGNRLFVFGEENSNSRPASLAIDKRGKILIADGNFGKISRYEIVRSKANPAEK